MAKIVTLTLNPAVDIAASVDAFVPAHKLRCTDVSRHPGGGGINVARAARRLGADVVAVYAAGGGSGDELVSLLEGEGLRHQPIRVGAHTRECMNVTDNATGEQYRLVLPGEALMEHENDACVTAAMGCLVRGDCFVVSGSLPPGAPPELLASAVRRAKAAGARTAADTQGDALRAVLEEGVDIVKVSARELADFLGRTPQSIAEWQSAAGDLVRAGKAELVAVTLGAQGAILAGRDGVWVAEVPSVQASTSVGAGDSFLAGLLVALLAGAPHGEALRLAAAAGTAALLTVGTGLCDRATAEEMGRRVAVRSHAP